MRLRPPFASSSGRPPREGTNCGFTGEVNTDWHVALTRSYKGHEADAIVVEPTPRFKRRHPAWHPCDRQRTRFRYDPVAALFSLGRGMWNETRMHSSQLDAP